MTRALVPVITIGIALACAAATLAGQQTAAPPPGRAQQTPPPGRAQQTPTPTPRLPPQPGAPRLVVLIVIDQFRADYIDMYSSQWTKGLRRLVDAGALFVNTAYPYAATFTCAGHATIGTGAFPATHGMSGNEFYDRALRRSAPCAFDADAAPIGFGGGTGKERHGPRSLLVPTFAEELRGQVQVAPKVVSLGQKPRTAITMAGRAGATGSETVAVWEEDDGTWATSAQYTRTPWPDVDEYVRAHPMRAAYGDVWNRLLPLESYKFVDDGAGEASPTPWTKVFPHPLISRTGQPDNEFVTRWVESPWDDAFLAGLAVHLLQSRKLGTGRGTDYLAISFPSTDHAGHQFGPRSHELQDALARVDLNLGKLFDALDAQVPGEYVVGLSSDHGVSLIPEQVLADKADGGRISGTDLRTAVNDSVGKQLGKPGTYLGLIYENQIALVPGVYDQLRRKRGGLNAVTAAIRGVKGVQSVYTAEDLVGPPSKNREIRAWQLSYVPGRSGDFAITPRRNWIIRATSGTTHGTFYDYDQRVPLILMGKGITSGRYTQPTTPADLAPTFAALVGIKMPRAEGRVLTEAIKK